MNESASMYNTFFDRIKNLERNSKALVVSSIGTTVRNVFGTTTAIGMDVAVKGLDTVIYAVSKTADNILGGRVKNEILDTETVIQRTVNNFTQIGNTIAAFTPRGQQRVADQFDMLLGDQPFTRSLLLNSLQEVGDKNKLWKISQVANTFNIAQDAFFRRALFVNSVRKQLKDGGVELDQLLAQGQKIPASIVTKASDDALKGTFAKLPNITQNPQGVEQKIETMAGGLIKSLENIPGTSLVIPFPRFMANAMAFQYRYSFFQNFKAVSSMMQAASLQGKKLDELKASIKFNKDLTKKLEAGEITKLQYKDAAKKVNPADVDSPIANPKYEESFIKQQELAANRMFAKSREELARGLVGTGLVLAAYQYRKNNQDSKWFEVKSLKGDGSTIDIRAIFPIAPFLALGDALAKIKDPKLNFDAQDFKGTLESIGGTKLLPMGLAQTGTDIINTFTSGDDPGSQKRIAKLLGEITGDFANRFQQPLQPFYGMLDALDKEYATGRDVTVTDATSGGQVYWETTTNKFFGRGSAAAQEFFSVVNNKVNPYAEELQAYLPKTKLEMPKALRKFDATAPVRGGEFFSTLQGFREVPRVNRLEQIFKDYDINPWPVYNSSGDSEFDRQVILESYKYLIGDSQREGFVYASLFGDTQAANKWKSLNDYNLQRQEIRNYLSAAVSMGRADAKEKLGLTLEGMNKRAKLWFNSQPEDIRKSMLRVSKQFSPEGKSFADNNNYMDAYLFNIKIYTQPGFNESFKAFGSEKPIAAP